MTASTHLSGASYLLVDGSSYIYRAFHALPPLSTSTGEPTWVIHGVISMLKKLQTTYPSHHIVIIFDAKGKNFRHELYPDYKAHRAVMPDELIQQIEPLYAIIKAMGLPVIMQEGIEADDIIGTLATTFTSSGKSVIISTGDKDFAQLVNTHITLIDTMKHTTLDIQSVEQKFGVPPHLIVDFLALQGDSSDNIPGVPKVGKKTACLLLCHLGGLEAIYHKINQVPTLPIRGARTLVDRLLTYKEQAFLSYKLATICTHLELKNFPLKIFSKKTPDIPLLHQWFKRLEFRSWLNKLETASQDAFFKHHMKQPSAHYEIITSEKTFLHWLEKLKASTCFAFDTETTAINYMQAKLVGLSFAVDPYHAAYVSFRTRLP